MRIHSILKIALVGTLAAASLSPSAGGESEKDDRRLRATEWTLRFRLQSSELVHRLHLHQRPIDAGAVLAVL